MNRPVTVRPMLDQDAEAVLATYQAGLDTGHASFRTTAPDWETFSAGKLLEHRYVALDGEGAVVGWVAAAPVSSRCVYAGVVESSVYVDPAAQGNCVGRLMLTTFITSTEAAGIWTIEAGIFPENTASLALHQRAGFRIVGRRERIGRHDAHGGRWRDVLLLERRTA